MFLSWETTGAVSVTKSTEQLKQVRLILRRYFDDESDITRALEEFHLSLRQDSVPPETNESKAARWNCPGKSACKQRGEWTF